MTAVRAADLAPVHFGWRLEGRVGIVTLNRPERKNPLTFASYAELRDFFHRLGDVSDVKVIVVTGAGDNFSSGGDVHDIIGPLVRMRDEQRHDDLLAFTRMTGDLVLAMRACPQPIIAAVDGICAGAGAIVAMASDLRIGTPRTKTGFLFVKVGLSGADMGACAILPRIIGQGRASELLYTGRFMTAAEGERWGFYNTIVGPDDVLSAAVTLATALADGPTVAHALTKRCLHEEWAMSVNDAVRNEAEVQAICMRTADFARAYHAFAQKVTPRFEGN